MMRRICLGIAVLTGLGSALLLGGAPTVHYDGQWASCGSPIADAYAPDGAPDDRAATPPPRGDHAAYVDYRVGQLCDQQQDRWTVLAGLGVLVSLLAATGAQVSREDEAVVTNDSDPEPALH
jgi:hypothetical protein